MWGQAAFHVFGMELLCKLPLASTNQFFATFFKLPGFYWRGFLASRLSSVQLIVFAMLTLVLAPPGIKVRHSHFGAPCLKAEVHPALG